MNEETEPFIRPHGRFDDAPYRAPGDRLLLLVALLMAIAMMAVIAFALGASYHKRLMIKTCKSEQVFYDLGETDTPYRCARIIDYPPN